MKVMIASDPNATTASASVDVSVGSYSDPAEHQGLAHFCEHMLFLSNEKYPVEDDYANWLAQNGGSSNAFTANNNTNFFFDVNPEALHEAIDRLAAFFKSPTFLNGASDDQVSREMHAVDAENSKNLKSYSWIQEQIMHDIARKNSTYYGFGTGNVETLKGGRELLQALTVWYKEHYSSHIMSLVVVGKQPLAQLREWVIQCFSDVPLRDGIQLTHSTDYRQTVPDSVLPRVTLIEAPAGTQTSVTVSWMLPSVMAETDSKPLVGVSAALGKEYAGSLSDALLSKAYISSMSASVDEVQDHESVFAVELSLTPQGLENVHDAVGLVFQAVAVAKDTVQQPEWFQSNQDAEKLAFQYAPADTDSDYAVGLSSALKEHYDLRSLPQSLYVTSTHAPARLVELLGLMSPARATVVVGGSNWSQLAQQFPLEHTQTEQWYHVRYGTRKLSSAEQQRLANPAQELVAKLSSTIVKNEYLPTDLSLVQPPSGSSPTAPITPRLLSTADGLDCYFAEDARFGTPHGYTALKLPISFFAAGPDGRLAASVLVKMANEELRTTYQMLADAGISLTIDKASTGLEIIASGFSQHLPNVTAMVLRKLSNVTKDGVRFQIAKEAVANELKAWTTTSPISMASTLTSRALNHLQVMLPPELTAPLKSMTLDHIFGTAAAFNLFEDEPHVLKASRKSTMSPLASRTVDDRLHSLETLAEQLETSSGGHHHHKQDAAPKKESERPKKQSPSTEVRPPSDLNGAAGYVGYVPGGDVGAQAVQQRTTSEALSPPAVSAHGQSGMIITGNFDEEAAHATCESVRALKQTTRGSATTGLHQAPTNSDDVQARRVLRSNYVASAQHPSKDQSQSAVLLTIQIHGSHEAKTDARAVLLSTMISSAFFADLRTKQQLGYIVGATCRAANGMRELLFEVQGTAKPPEHVASSILTFVEQTAPKVLNEMSDKEFETFVASTTTSLLERPISVADQGNLFFSNLAENCSNRFGYAQVLADAITKTTRTDVIALAAEIADREGDHKRYLLQLFGEAQKPMPEHPEPLAHFERAEVLAQHDDNTKYSTCHEEMISL